jgi:hypothetical protein
MNAVFELVAALPRPALARLLRGQGGCAGGDVDRLRRRLADRFALDLAGLLNQASRAELELLAAAARLPAGGHIGELRARLWRHGAEREAGGPGWLGTPLQPVPIVLRGKLVPLADPGGLAPPAPSYPRPIPDPAPGCGGRVGWGAAEPDTLEDLLARGDALLGVRLGPAGRDKGGHGARVAALLGVRERGEAEPDWRGEVEIKTVPVVRDRSGFWRVKEDPAVAMEHADAPAKLARVLWIARVADDPESPVLCWFYQERDPHLFALQRRHLHTRPKGGAGATTRGWYLRKAFFAASGFLAALNGP